MRGGLVATGTVTDPSGKPVPGVVVVRGDHPYWEWGSQEVRSDEQGRYTFPPLRSGLSSTRPEPAMRSRLA